MKPISVSSVFTFVFAFFFCSFSRAQTITSSAVWISDCNQNNYYNTSGLIGPSGNVFTNYNFGTHTQNSQTLIIRGGEVRTFKTVGVTNVCGAKLHYSIYSQGGGPGTFNAVDLLVQEDCDASNNQYPSGGSCLLGDQKWNMIIDDGTTTPYAPVDLTAFAPGNYVLEVYYDITGSSTSTTACDETITLNNGGSNYKAFFSIQAPSLASANPTSCNGSEGFITISGLTPGAIYDVSYTDDGNPVGPLSKTASGAGQIVISGLNAGIYSDFDLAINGCETNLNTGLILSNPVIIPKFNKIAAFCAGTTAPALPTSSLNGITGTWNPATINNTTSGSYTFTPNANQCGQPLTINVIVTPRITPTFSFGTSLTICEGQSVPVLPTTSQNGISGIWSPSTVSNTTSAIYTFTPSGSQCATGTTFTVTVNPNITPSFSFGTSMTICAGTTVPALPTTSSNGINGTWSPSMVDNQNTGSYIFTPTPGQCATAASFNVTVNPNLTPTFGFGPTLSICAGASVPTLPNISNNGISGTWSPSAVDNQNSGSYVFTPASGLCAPPVTFTVTVAPNITPAFPFGTSLTICAGQTVPSLPNISNNGITGTWNPSTVDNQNTATYIFTPDAGQCATPASFTVTVNSNVTPAFLFGTTLTICAGQNVPGLPTISSNGITGTWSPTAVDNQNTGTYIFTPGAGQCAVPGTFDVTVNPIITPVFGFGPALTICAGNSVPTLPAASNNGINGTWSPSVVDNQNSGSYVFTPNPGQCATTYSFNVTVNPIVTPLFSFGSSTSICAGSTAPALPTNSLNGITGTWSPSAIDNQNTSSYTFTPNPGQCAVGTSLNVTVNSNITPTFGFGTSLTICAGSGVPALSATSLNGITGTWSPALVDNQTSGTYIFTPTPGQCALPTNFVVTVNQNTIPTFAFGTSLVICAGGNVPSLPATSTNGIAGSWSPSTVDNQASGVYTFTPDPVTGQCLASAQFIVTVNQKVIPTFNFGTALTVCNGGNIPILPTTSSNGISGTWLPSAVSNTASANYVFTPSVGQCVLSGTTLDVTVTPVAIADNELDTIVTDGTIVPIHLLTGTPNGVSFSWANSNTSIGLGSSGAGNVPSFTATNPTANTIKGTITVMPTYNGCVGAAKSYTITVVPLDKDIFVPNVFTPNGDGKNDILYAYSNYISSLEMRIFNQYGQQVELITDPRKGWDGKYKGTPQPVGVYMYALKAIMTDGRTLQLKGNITLLR